MAHLNDLYEAQAKALLIKLCDALGMAEEDRTKSGIEAAIGDLSKLEFNLPRGKDVNLLEYLGRYDEDFDK